MTTPKSKKCGRCKKTKRLTSFGLDKNRRLGRGSYCLDCLAMSVRRARMKHYGFTREQIEDRIAEQGGVCACCGQRKVSLRRGRTHHEESFIDYRRGSEIVPNIVCSKCNPQLNTVKNDPVKVYYLASTQVSA